MTSLKKECIPLPYMSDQTNWETQYEVRFCRYLFCFFNISAAIYLWLNGLERPIQFPTLNGCWEKVDVRFKI